MAQYELIEIKELKPYENNARTHSDEQIDLIINSIREFGFINPVIVDENNMILVGHGRTMAAERAGFDKVPFRRVEGLTEDQKRAYILADNKLSDLGGWDFDILSEELDSIDLDMSDFGFDIEIEPMNNNIDETPDTKNVVEDETPELPEETNTKQGDIYILGEHRIMCGDSTAADDFVKLMNGKQARLCVTSPPYGVGMKYEEKGIEPWRKTISGVIRTITKHCRVICWNIGDLFATDTQFIEPTSMYSTEYMKQNGFDILFPYMEKARREF